MNPCVLYYLGTIEYNRALELQNRLVAEVAEGKLENVLLLLEHPPVITIGRTGSEANIILPVEQLAEEGIPVVSIDRGGDITYHGPGQLVGYLLLDLRTQGRDLHRYVRNLEEVIIRCLAGFGIKGERHPKFPGVWVGDEKICSLGISVHRWITKHGFGLNVNTDLRHFDYINPCGTGKKMTSISKLLGQDIEMKGVTESLLGHIAEVFNLDIIEGVPGALSGQR